MDGGAWCAFARNPAPSTILEPSVAERTTSFFILRPPCTGPVPSFQPANIHSMKNSHSNHVASSPVDPTEQPKPAFVALVHGPADRARLKATKGA